MHPVRGHIAKMPGTHPLNWDGQGADAVTPEAARAAMGLEGNLRRWGLDTEPKHWLGSTDGGIMVEIDGPGDGGLLIDIGPDGQHPFMHIGQEAGE